LRDLLPKDRRPEAAHCLRQVQARAPETLRALADLLPANEDRVPRVQRFLLDLDARLDTMVFDARASLEDCCELYVTWMERLAVTGWRRAVVEACSEGATLGAGGLVLMLALAVPAFRQAADPDGPKKPELSVTFLDRDGGAIGSRGVHHDESTPLAQYPDYLIDAVLATEDRRFYEHPGIDLLGTIRALAADIMAGGVVQGGSSISQQLAKNLFLTSERSVGRKIEEAFLALWLESRLSKDEILTLYLDRAYMGSGTFGIEAAAQFYFGKSAREVNLAEAAMLAGLFKAPTRFAPSVNLPAARARARIVLDNLVQAGFLTEGQVFGARTNPAAPIDRGDANSPTYDEHAPNYYLDWAFNETRKLVETFPKSMTGRDFTVRTAIDMGAQRATEKTIETSLREHGREYHATQSAAVLMDLDGGVRAMVGGRDYGRSQFNRAVDARLQPGSSFKPYVYATALVNGMKPTSIVDDAPICIGNWCPQNYENSYAGRMTLTSALTHSINTVAVQLSIIIGGGDAKIGRAKIVETARKMGLRTPLPDVASLPLGADEVTMLEHTGAYATFSNLGKAVTPHAIVDVRTPDGHIVWRFDRDGKKPEQVISPQVATQMIFMMNKVVEDGTGKRAMLEGVHAAGKTGTTSAYRDAWFVGFTGNYVCGVWFGNDDHSPTERLNGGLLPATTWHDIMTSAHKGIDVKNLPGLAPNPATGEIVERKPPAPELRPFRLTERGGDALRDFAQQMETATSALPSHWVPPDQHDAVASATEHPIAVSGRGN
jgi:penicillin-binding protein 1A